MLPLIDKKKTGVNLRRLMDERGLTVKDVQKYLELGSVQSVYHWINGISMPTVDNLYALSYLFQVPVDDMICGNRCRIHTGGNLVQKRRLYAYYYKINEIRVA
uniref:helix-turn-helix domain-containing protein n=1 Tax=Agathobacter sp. TaxID=2021311 RepID=UPI004055F69C